MNDALQPGMNGGDSLPIRLIRTQKSPGAVPGLFCVRILGSSDLRRMDVPSERVADGEAGEAQALDHRLRLGLQRGERASLAGGLALGLAAGPAALAGALQLFQE